jgi:hypothetical protein
VSMSTFTATLDTSKGVQLKNEAVFLRDLDVLYQMFQDCSLKEVNVDVREGYAFLTGTEYADVEISLNDREPWQDRLPPDDWTEPQKEAHAAVFGYLPYWRKVMKGDTLQLIAFLQHHMVENTCAILSGTNQEDGDCWYWTVGFTPQREVWMTRFDVEKDLERRLMDGRP